MRRNVERARKGSESDEEKEGEQEEEWRRRA